MPEYQLPSTPGDIDGAIAYTRWLATAIRCRFSVPPGMIPDVKARAVKNLYGTYKVMYGREDAEHLTDERVELVIYCDRYDANAILTRWGKEVPTSLTKAEEHLLYETFGVGGICACDGAMDDGCPCCTDQKREEWIEAIREISDRLR